MEDTQKELEELLLIFGKKIRNKTLGEDRYPSNREIEMEAIMTIRGFINKLK